MSDDQTYVTPISATVASSHAFPEIHHHYNYYEAPSVDLVNEVADLREQIVDLKNLLGAVLPEMITSLNAVTFGQINMEEEMALDMSALESGLAQNTSVVDSAVSLLGSLAQEIRDAAGDPGRVAAIADALDANTGRLANAIKDSTIAAEEPPAPVEPPVEPPVEEVPAEGGVTDDGTEITPEPTA